ncbi:hypothetical protein OU995_09245 [Roseateles sp. SL47]|jgi:hypothetical protein|uniref:hypothetical protein n=1 Tax=Roseateles sp. SL47 TaxID=2995138 RepID=UPI00226F9073|nr:hypothetical protein [Roseateles sp. SL47]WAC74860.1 hypothetical protein OU995_09245 [Roseateles sp. SL47]
MQFTDRHRSGGLASHPDSLHRGELPRLMGNEYLHWQQPVVDGQGYFHLIKEN